MADTLPQPHSDPPPSYEETESQYPQQQSDQVVQPFHSHSEPHLQSTLYSTTIGFSEQPPPPNIHDITLDGTLIYPTTPPATALYATSFHLDLGHHEITISRLVPRRSRQNANIWPVQPREKDIYSFRRLPMLNTVEITGRSRSTIPGVLLLKPTQKLLKSGWVLWHVRRNTETMLFRVKPTRSSQRREMLRWQDGGGGTVAVETVARGSGDDVSGHMRQPRLQIDADAPLDEMLMDALVTAWCARIWIGSQFKRGE
ncbi:hypothetical protein PAAG_07442 [Paracoccidioides lutzii Pb01]|uniref:Uncharacterized protein n=1 Tax=Paracoccidioides lutzii (strain ATCC MYA-826 / Pb01) TaxID=502779 RepID=C1H9K1_PARBA|nr:hypothetical protein PAAG_07442 [Paracoccidioides lutzii Pb01]EEH37024.2 hypothetical protein PAAG_07442 [Paracoccidioides lutzii Pb01]